jgi:hypothetical protein
MGTYIDHVEWLSGELAISEEGERWLDNPQEDCFPECPPKIENGKVVKMWWSGEGSGNAVADGTLAKFFSFTRGTAEFVFYWKGMGPEGYRVVDGVMTKHEVEMKLGKEIK